MFIRFIKGLASRSVRTRKIDDAALPMQLQAAVATAARGDLHAAALLFQQYLQRDPYNVDALNDLGACFASNGDSDSARRTFELAYSLDDSSLPVMVNYANVLREDANSADSLAILRRAKLCEPRFSQTDTEYARICFGRGELDVAKHFRLRGWLEEFDNIRHGNGYMFLSSYCDIDEAELAAEHLFWASTLRPPAAFPTLSARQHGDVTPPTIPRKTRIGYWSPDLRSHAVRYFARPLIENHDPAQFEIFVYHDFLSSDAHTSAIKEHAQHFFDVHLLGDAELCTLIDSHGLDILMELAGHTSYNRLPLLQNRLARLQITALGYPPTTGLETIDAKLLDTTVVTADSSRYYTETPLALPTSFWCFDPMEAIPIASEPPVVRNGHITFGCVGNIAKITDPILRCWKQILDRAPETRLVIRSVNFYDSANLEATKRRLAVAGLDEDRLDFKQAEGGLRYFATYDDVDIILDTYPFNGGTTSCFAAYMGVPVLSWSGQSLLSRMGLSISTNMEAPNLSVKSAADYVERALQLASDRKFLLAFKGTARETFKRTALGNGVLFAREFEKAAMAMLLAQRSGTLRPPRRVRPLPAEELTKRAYAVLLSNQVDAANRILSHCLQHHPHHDPAHLLTAQILNIAGKFDESEIYLTSRLAQFNPANQISALIQVIRCALLRNDRPSARAWLARLGALQIDDAVDRLQLEIYQSCCAQGDSATPPTAESSDLLGECKRVHVIISAPTQDRFERNKASLIAKAYIPASWSVSYEHCSSSKRSATYRHAMARPELDLLLLVPGNLTTHRRSFFLELDQSLRHVDVVSSAGALRWARLDWRSDDFGMKFGALIAGNSPGGSLLELQWIGTGRQPLVRGMAVLDGSFLALGRRAMQRDEFDVNLIDADYLLEEDWSHRASLAGLTLAVHRGLGVSLASDPESRSKYRASGRLHLAEKMGFDPFKVAKDDFLTVSTPVTSPDDAIRVLDLFSRADGYASA